MQQWFTRNGDGALTAEGVLLSDVAREFGTPTYVYSISALKDAYLRFANACLGRNASVQYAMKANSNLAVLQTFARLGAGFDIVSGGELIRVLAAGGDPRKVVFSGVGKSTAEIRLALQSKVRCFNVESLAELARLNDVALEMGVRAPVSLRVNPDVDPQTHPYISTGLKENKFGIAYEAAYEAHLAAVKLPGIRLQGIDFHIGSQITALEPYLEALDKVLDLVEHLEAEGIPLHHIDVGGGLGIVYSDETPPEIDEFVTRILDHVASRGRDHCEIVFEPGRSLVGNAGVLLTTVEYIKKGPAKNFCIVDAAMNDIARPAMYGSYHRIEAALREGRESFDDYDVVGPVCESGDWLGRDRRLAVAQGDLLAICSAGAYGFAMSSNYNSRPRAAEVMIDGTRTYLVRERERIDAFLELERLLP